MERQLVEESLQIGGIGGSSKVLGGPFPAKDLAALGVAQTGVLSMANLMVG